VLDEFSLIKQYFERPSTQSAKANPQLVKGIGDDCAILNVPQGCQLVFSIDTLVEGVHFPVDAKPEDIAWRLLGAAVSDLAAMGATPNHFTLALTLPELSNIWLKSFSENLAQAADHYQITLVGGDTTKGPLTLSVQVQGFVETGKALLRNGAQVDDVICVTGSLGDSRAGLSLLTSQEDSDIHRYLRKRFYRPQARVSTGLLINQYASACIDISDGLLADLGHILVSSDKGACIDSQVIPLSREIKAVAGDDALDWALTGGEDFELCFTVSATKWSLLQQALADTKHLVAISKIGTIKAESGIEIYKDAKWQSIAARGFNHFSS